MYNVLIKGKWFDYLPFQGRQFILFLITYDVSFSVSNTK
jgi:hypothetical protein